MSSKIAVGALITLREDAEGQYTAHQVGLQLDVGPPNTPEVSIPINWSFGPVTISGFVDTSSLSISVSVSVLGINLGTFHGNLKDGIGIKVDLFLVVGDIRLSLKNGNEVWVYLALKVKFDGSFNGDYKIITL